MWIQLIENISKALDPVKHIIGVFLGLKKLLIQLIILFFYFYSTAVRDFSDLLVSFLYSDDTTLLLEGWKYHEIRFYLNLEITKSE